MAVSIDLTNPDTRPKPSPSTMASGIDAGKIPLVGLTRTELAETLAETGVPEKQARMRASQIWHWLYIRGVSDFCRHEQYRQGIAR